MPIGDLMAEWFENERLRALLAGPGVSGTMLGPRSAGSSLVLLLREACRLRAGGRSLRARGGPGARDAGDGGGRTRGRRRDPDRRRRRTHPRAATGASLASWQTGRRSRAGPSCPGWIPKTTFLSLVDPAELAPEFATKVRNYRASGTVAKVNLALASLPAFRGVADPMTVDRQDSHRTGPRLPRAGVRLREVRRGLDGSVAGHHDSVDRRHGTGAAGRSRCIDLHALLTVRASRRGLATWQRTCS